LSGLHSIGPLRFQASSPEWAFRPDAAESALKVLLQLHHDYHLDHHLGHRLPVLRRRRELPAVLVRRLHFEPQALRLHVERDRHLPQERRVRLVPRPGRNQ
jgi:hypothetical protein